MGYAVQHGMHYLVTAIVSSNRLHGHEEGSDRYSSSWGSSLQELRSGLSVPSDTPLVPFLLVAVIPLGSSCEADTLIFGHSSY
jgi:hypothetical protein